MYWDINLLAQNKFIFIAFFKRDHSKRIINLLVDEDGKICSVTRSFLKLTNLIE